ncbi:MAG: hypothetical protein KKF30_18940 [Proteobacteria bacterium]|nr:hypothetical protein [Pseudomonadota bacterium]
MQQKDLRQISDLMDQKFETKISDLSDLMDQKFEKNNKILKKEIVQEIDKKIDSKIDELALMTKKGFDKVDERFEKAEKEIAKRPTKKEIFDWADRRIIDVELDIDKVKYIHRDEWKKLPRAYEIKKILVENKIT